MNCRNAADCSEGPSEVPALAAGQERGRLLADVWVVFLIRFTPSFLRLGSWNVMMFVTYEQLKRALMKVQMFRESPF